MEIDHRKLFVGGISRDTSEDCLRGYFQNFGDVMEAVIMRDRATGRARGFGFVVFADPAVAEKVVQQKHSINGRNVEAKKAVPRDDQNNVPRNARCISLSPIPLRTKKIFVGGLPSSITESDFKMYFDQFGSITDLVVMHDQNSQRPRGFGFITYDTEDAVDRALYKTFHELKGKMVEVKRAVPKELSPGSNRSLSGRRSSGMSKVSSFTNGYIQGGYASSPTNNHVGRSVGRVSPGGIPGFVSLYGRGLLEELNLNSSWGLNANLNQNLSYVKESTPLYSRIPGRPINSGPSQNSIGGSPLPSQARGSLWGNDGLNFALSSADFTGSGSEYSSTDPYGSIGQLWVSPSSLIDHKEFNGSKFGNGMPNFGSIDECSSESYRRNSVGLGIVGPPPSLYSASRLGYNSSLDIYQNGLAYRDPSRRSSSSSLETEDSSSSFRLWNASADAITRGSASFIGFGMAAVK